MQKPSWEQCVLEKYLISIYAKTSVGTTLFAKPHVGTCKNLNGNSRFCKTSRKNMCKKHRWNMRSGTRASCTCSREWRPWKPSWPLPAATLPSGSRGNHGRPSPEESPDLLPQPVVRPARMPDGRETPPRGRYDSTAGFLC